MSYLDFKPTNCRNCGNLIWAGVSATSRCDIKLDTNRGIATYELHRTAVSFEATRRMATRMSVAAPIVVATHTCRPITVFAEQPPDYFNRPKLSTTSEKVPF